MQRGAESNDPTWLASLATLLQANSGLRSSLILRSSVPVEQYEKRMLFFCKQGKQKHDRTGFYWGAPSVTSNGYNWSGKFLSDYNRRRHSKDGKDMMGMIFRTDTYKFLSAKVVANLAMEAVSAVGKNPDQLRPGSWAKTLPTIATYLNLSQTERLSLGLSHDAGEGGDEEPITSRYAEASKGLSRHCKKICAAAVTSLAKWDVQTFNNLTYKEWEELAENARFEAGLKPLDANAIWRNPDITKSKGGFKMKKSQMTFPKQLAGIPLSPETRDGQKYCADFQAGTCQEGASCRSGAHRCAALFRSGRTCHGNHAGSMCGNTKRHADSAEADTQEGPVRKATKTQNPGSHTRPNDTSMPEAPDYVTDDSIMRQMLPDLGLPSIGSS